MTSSGRRWGGRQWTSERNLEHTKRRSDYEKPFPADMRTKIPIQTSVTFLLVAALLLLSADDVTGQSRRRQRRPTSWRQTRTSRTGSRRSSSSSHMAHKPPGPNMCKVQEVLGTRKKFFTHCLSRYLKVICDRPTYDRWECCSGFLKEKGETGCTGVKPLSNIMELANDLKLAFFRKHARLAGLDDELSENGAYTVFAPTDTAVWEAPNAIREQLSEAQGTSPPLLQYHMTPGRVNVSSFRKRGQQFITLFKGLPIRVNKYAYGVATVNCARIIRPDEMATNGIVHVVDKVLNPLDVDKTIAEKLAMNERYSLFNMAMLVSDMAKKLRSRRGAFTVLAPDDAAFSKLPQETVDAILRDADTAEKVVRRHVVRGVFCADAIVVAVGLKTMDESRLLFRCRRDGLTINEAKVKYPDMVARNGVIHGIDTVLLPDSVKSVEELMHDMRLDRFMKLVGEAGLNETIHTDNVTVFGPSDKAIEALPGPYLAALIKEPDELRRLVGYHTIQGKLSDDRIVGDVSLNTMSEIDAKIRVTVYRSGVMIDKSKLDPSTRQCRNALVRRVDKVLVPPDTDLLGKMAQDARLSDFLEMVRDSRVGEDLSPAGSYTILAPTNAALDFLDQRQLRDIKRNFHRLRRFVRRHIIQRTVMKCSIPESGTYTIVSQQGDVSRISLNWKKKMVINKHAYAISDDLMTYNGILYAIDHVLPCSCEVHLRNRRGRYINTRRYRRT